MPAGTHSHAARGTKRLRCSTGSTTTRTPSKRSGSRNGGSTTPTRRSAHANARTASTASATTTSARRASPALSRGTPSSSADVRRSRAAGSTAAHACWRTRSSAPEHAWLAVREAEVALACSRAGDRTRGRAARDLDRRAAPARGGAGGRPLARGRSLVHEGRIDEGMRRLDESAVAATAGDVKDMMWIGKVCCNLIAACERVGDDERATQWCDEVKEFAQRWRAADALQRLPHAVRVGLDAQGRLGEAEAELEAAIAAFTRRTARALVKAPPSSASCADGRAAWTRLVRCSPSRRPLDRRGSAAPSWRSTRATRHRACARGAARAGDRGLAPRPRSRCSRPARPRGSCSRPTATPQPRPSRELDALAARRRHDRRARHGRTCRRPEQRIRRAAISSSRSAQARGCGRSSRSLRRALRAGARPDLARAGPLRARPPDGRAQAEAIAARDAVLRARRAARPVDGGPPLGGPAGLGRGDAPHASASTRCSHYVAAGRSNREIATELVVSQHTVHRHVANILRKLTQPTRAAAAAQPRATGSSERALARSGHLRRGREMAGSREAIRPPAAETARFSQPKRGSTACRSSRSS